MPRGFGRLPFLGRRSTHQDRSDGSAPVASAAIDPDTAPIGPPILMPAAIIRQVLFDSTELIPVWARPRPAFEPALATAGAPAPAPPKRTRKPKPEAAATSAKRASTTPATAAKKASTTPATAAKKASTIPASRTRKRNPAGES